MVVRQELEVAGSPPESGGKSSRAARNIRVERGNGALALLDERWDHLVLRQRAPNPTLTSTWLRQLATRESGVPLVIVVHEGERLLAAGAFALRRPFGRGGPSLATWLGESPLIFSPDLLVDEQASDAPGALVDALLAEALGARLSLVPLAGSAAEALLWRAPWLSAWPRGEGWRTVLPPEPLQRRIRETAYERRRAERLGATVEVKIMQEPDAVGLGLERLFELHEQRWRGRYEIARFSATEELRAWYRSTVNAMAICGRVRIVEVNENGEPAASLLGFVFGRGALLHTTAVRPGGHLKAAGHIAMLGFVEAAQAAGAAVLDLGRGSGEPGGPKADLAPVRIPFAGLLAGRSWLTQRVLEVPLAFQARFRATGEEPPPGP
jgi:hypothetical protein